MVGIYKITNQINNKVYIGQTQDIERRFRQHHTEPFNENSTTYNVLLYRAIRKYGIENFSFEIIEQCNQEALDCREKYWIAYYKSYIHAPNAWGYNMTEGGQTNSFSRVYDYGKIKELWDFGLSHSDIISQVKCSTWTLSQALNTYSIPVPERLYRSNLYKAIGVNQYTLQGKFINSYPSIAAAVRNLQNEFPHASTGNICAACKKRIASAYGYIWRYADDNVQENLQPTKHFHHHKVNQYNIDGTYLATYNTIQAAIKENNFCVGISAIINACVGLSKTCCGYIWRYYDDIAAAKNININRIESTSINLGAKQKNRPVLQYSLDGKFLQEFSSCTEAAKAVGLSQPSGISRACSGLRKTAKGFIWKYKEQKEARKNHEILQ